MGETATEPKPRIRWYQFSLASLFRLTTIIAILLGISRMIGVHVFFCTMAVLVILGCAFTPLLLLVLLCSLTNLSEKSILRIEVGVLVILFALAIVLDVTAGLVGGVVVGTSLLLFLWGPQCLIIVCGFLATRTDNADCKLRRKVLPTELELDEHTDCSY